MKERRPAEAFPPSSFIMEEMAQRDWTVNDLAHYAVVPVDKIQAILDGAPITGHYAERLAVAFGTSALYWANLWMAWKKYGKTGGLTA